MLLRTMELNPTIHFLIVGDMAPKAARWPSNCAFHHFSLRMLLKRAQSSLGAAPANLHISGGASKVSDLKPMLAHLFPELLRGCDFWGWMQEDQLLGDLRSFLDNEVLSRFDVISPLVAPLHHAGPFMVLRHTRRIDALYRQSSQWRAVLTEPEYLAFVR